PSSAASDVYKRQLCFRLLASVVGGLPAAGRRPFRGGPNRRLARSVQASPWPGHLTQARRVPAWRGTGRIDTS
ncbi:hypothetical protein, partial [Mesorhizobium sp. IMUNJ 23232]|uniref:hypothetical protein n=1 Tax=Mesorhizobium sp. IMUNJ 23232 TaxID=3376064 RepID=UPI0037AD832D